MSSQSVAQKPPLPKEEVPSLPESRLEDSLLNPVWANGARGGVGVARRRIGMLITALMTRETHPILAAENIRDTVREELCELEAILEVVEQEMTREEKNAAASAKGAER